VASFLVYCCKDMFFKPRTVLYIAVADDRFNTKKLENFEKQLEKYLGANGKTDVVVVNTDFDSTNLQSLTHMQTYAAAGTIDVLIANKKGYSQWAQGGYMLDPESSNLVSFYQSYAKEDRLYTEYETGPEIRGEKKPSHKKYNFGIRITSGSKYRLMGSIANEMYAGIPVEAKHKQAAAEFLKFMMNDHLKLGTVDQKFIQAQKKASQNK
jgi:ABC-type glycerol-3-phosphate transport system substrate-binding protein